MLFLKLFGPSLPLSPPPPPPATDSGADTGARGTFGWREFSMPSFQESDVHLPLREDLLPVCYQRCGHSSRVCDDIAIFPQHSAERCIGAWDKSFKLNKELSFLLRFRSSLLSGSPCNSSSSCCSCSCATSETNVRSLVPMPLSRVCNSCVPSISFN